MKTNNVKNNFVKEVKQLLDNADWDFEASDPRGHYNDCYKAMNYLSTQRFSEKSIREELEEYWDDIRESIRENEVRSHEDAVKLAAKKIGDILAWKRISKFSWTYANQPHSDNSWYIPESVMFKIL